MKLKTRLGMSAAFVAVAGGLAWGAGMWSTLPIVGSPAFCVSTVTGAGAPFSGATGQGQGTTGAICAQTVPAGPAGVTGVELVPADVNANGTTNPQTVTIPTALLGPSNPHVNRIIGGDFGTNLWQRGTTPLSAASPTTAVMSADRWWAISASNVVTITKQTPASTAADYLGNIGFNSWMRVARPSGTPSGATCVGQILDKAASAPLIGNNAVFSFYGYAPTTFSATNSNVVVTIAYYTAADASAAQSAVGAGGTNTLTFALSSEGAGGGIAGYQAATAGGSNGTTAVVASGAATISLSTTPTRYSVYGPIPSANASGTQVIGVGVSICNTPTIATSVTTDYFEFTAAQIQALPSTVSNSLPAGVTSPTGFERRSAEIEQGLQQYYSYVLSETTAKAPFAPCAAVDTTHTNCWVQFPETMRITPVVAYTAGFASPTSTTQATLGNCSALATAATVSTSTNNNQGALVNCTATTIPVAGTASFFYNNGGGGVISASSEP